MKLTTLISLLLVPISIFGQTKKYSEKEVYSLFKKSILQNSKKSISTFSNPWVYCNQDSSYLKKDTIKISNKLHYADNNHCCSYIGWTFYKKNKFILNDFDNCSARVKATKNENFYSIRMISKADSLYLKMYNINDKLISNFRIFRIDENLKSNSTQIILIRI